MTEHAVGTREEWLAARTALLADEKELTRRSDGAPLANIGAYRERMGWSFPWVSAAGSDFNLDFSVFTEEGRRAGTPRGREGWPRRHDEYE